MKRTWIQTPNGLVETTVKRDLHLSPLIQQKDRHFSFDPSRQQRAEERHERKLDIKDSIERASSSGYSRREQYYE